MSKQIVALKLALEALEVATTPLAKDRQEVLRARAAIQEVLAQLEQEPVAYMVRAHGMLQRLSRRADVADEIACQYRKEDPNAEMFPLYTTPPQRKPLTDEEILECWKQAYEPGRREHDNAARMARAIEAKLREKNA